MEAYRNKLSSARDALEKAHGGLVDVYLNRARERYLSLNERGKDAFLKNLELLIDKSFYDKRTRVGADGAVVKIIVLPEECREARTRLGITQVELAKELGISQPILSKFETHGIKKRTRVALAYINWLKEKGYEL